VDGIKEPAQMDGYVIQSALISYVWQRGSVVRMSVFGWQTFHDLWLTLCG